MHDGALECSQLQRPPVIVRPDAGHDSPLRPACAAGRVNETVHRLERQTRGGGGGAVGCGCPMHEHPPGSPEHAYEAHSVRVS